MEFPNKIEVLIPKQIFFVDKYIKPENCYLAESLKKLGYTNFSVYEEHDGEILTSYVYFNNDFYTIATYKPKMPFNRHTVMNAFGFGQNISVTLIKQ